MAVRAQAAAERALQQARHFGGAGEQHALHARVGHQRGAHGLARPGQQLHGRARHAGRPQRAHGGGGNERRLFGGLGQHRVAGGQCCSHLADEDGQRKIPRADAHHRPQRLVGGVVEAAANLLRVIAQKVHRLAHFGHCVGAGLAGFAHEQRDQGFGVGFQAVRGGFESCRAVGRRCGRPTWRDLCGADQRGFNVVESRVAHRADGVRAVGWVEYHARQAGRACG